MGALRRSHVAAFVGVVVLIAVGNGGTCGATEAVDHAFGGDEGWDFAAAAAAAAQSGERTFRVGDSIWLAHLATEGSVAELGSREEFDACDLSNPIRMYTGGAPRVRLDGEGPRYFASRVPGGCRGGLKLHVQVLPRGEAGDQTEAMAGAALGADFWPPPPPPNPFWLPPPPPPPPSASVRLEASEVLMWAGVAALCFVIGSFHGV